MDKISKQIIPIGILGDMGIALTRFRCGQMRLIFREKPTQDHGIDAEIEIIEGKYPTGRVLSAQVKCGDSYFKESSDTSITFRFSAQHYEYWNSHSLPVIVILVEHHKELCYWALLTSDNAVSTGEGYKVDVPKTQILNFESREKLVDLTTPILPSASYELLDEDDVSHGSVRRISHYYLLNASSTQWTKYSIRQLILQVTSQARSSQYFRNDISENTHRHSDPQVVWIYIYQSESHRDLGAYIARALWVDPELPKENWPTGIEGQALHSGITIDWSNKFAELVNAIDDKRTDKASYLQYLKPRLEAVEKIINRYKDDTEGDFDFQAFSLAVSIESEFWKEHPLPTQHLQRLSDRAEEMFNLLDNARIFSDRSITSKDRPNLIQLTKYISSASTKLHETRYELSLIT